MSNRTVTLRLPEDLVEYITRNGDGINQAVVSELSYLRRIRQVSLGELKGLFTNEEWMFLADAFNGTMTDETFCSNTGAFIAACEDAEKFDGTASKYGVDFPEFRKKCEQLRGANVESIYSRISDFWNHPEMDLSEWAIF